MGKDNGCEEKQVGAIAAIAAKTGCLPQTLRVGSAARDGQGMRDRVTIEQRDRIKAFGREVREPRHANEVLRKASAYFAHSLFAV